MKKKTKVISGETEDSLLPQVVGDENSKSAFPVPNGSCAKLKIKKRPQLLK